MLRLVSGVIKGGVIGAGLGYGAYRLGLPGGIGWLLYGLVGLAVGLVVGRPLWSHLADKKSTVWTAILKGLVGFGVGVGLWALGAKAAGDPMITFQGETHALTAWQPIFGAAVGVVYGLWVELDDPPVKRIKQAKPEPQPAKRKA
jgi:hypothetical protein